MKRQNTSYNFVFSLLEVFGIQHQVPKTIAGIRNALNFTVV